MYNFLISFLFAIANKITIVLTFAVSLFYNPTLRLYMYVSSTLDIITIWDTTTKNETFLGYDSKHIFIITYLSTYIYIYFLCYISLCYGLTLPTNKLTKRQQQNKSINRQVDTRMYVRLYSGIKFDYLHILYSGAQP